MKSKLSCNKVNYLISERYVGLLIMLQYIYGIITYIYFNRDTVI